MGNPRSDICKKDSSEEKQSKYEDHIRHFGGDHKSTASYLIGESGKQSLRLPSWISNQCRVEIKNEFLLDSLLSKPSSPKKRGYPTPESVVSLSSRDSSQSIFGDMSLSQSSCSITSFEHKLEHKEANGETAEQSLPQLDLSQGGSESSKSCSSISLIEHDVKDFHLGGEGNRNYLRNLRTRIYLDEEGDCGGSSVSSIRSLLDIDFEAIDIFTSLQHQLLALGIIVTKNCEKFLMEKIKIMMEFADGMLTQSTIEEIFMAPMRRIGNQELGEACCQILSAMMGC